MTLIMLKCYNVVGRTVVSEQGMQAWQESAYYLPKVFKSWQVNPDVSGRGQFLSKHHNIGCHFLWRGPNALLHTILCSIILANILQFP